MVPEALRPAVIEALEDGGFEPFKGQWIRPLAGRIELVELLTPEDWALSNRAANELFNQARPLPGLSPLFAPSPYHELLVLARKLRSNRGRLSTRHFRRIESALADLPDAWEVAQSLSEDWGGNHDLHRLRKQFHKYTRPRRPKPFGLPHRGAIIALSGLDGAGKSTQAQLLCASLTKLGRDVKVVWAPLGNNPGLAKAALLIKRFLARLPFGPLAGADPTTIAAPLLTPAGDPAQGRTRQLAVVIWWFVVAVADVLSRRRAVVGTLVGRVIIFDRYTLDAAVDLRVSTRPFAGRRIVEHLIRLLSPRPDVAIYLAVTPEEAHARKPDWALADTVARAAVYTSECHRHGAHFIDATSGIEEIAAQVAREVLSSVL